MAIKRKEEYWSRFQKTYDENQEFVVGKDLLDKVKKKLQDLSDLGEALELGCGTGNFSDIIAQKSEHLFATDLSDELLEIAQKRLYKYENIIYQKEDCMQISFPSEKFDTVFMANLIHVIENPLITLQESHRILKNNGRLIITGFTNHNMKSLEKIKLGFRFIKVWGKPPRHTHAFSPNNLSSLMESVGFIMEESQIIGSKTKSLYLIGRKKANPLN